MSVTQYLEHARTCVEIADRLPGEDRTKLIDIGHVWLELAHDKAKAAIATGPRGSLTEGVTALDQDRLYEAITGKKR